MRLIARMLKGAALAMAVPVIAYGGTPSDTTEIDVAPGD